MNFKASKPPHKVDIKVAMASKKIMLISRRENKHLKTLLIMIINKEMAAQSRETRQKKIIEEEVEKEKSFFTSDSLFSKIKAKDKNIGIATVYRFLKDLRAKGKIHTYLCDKKILYSKGEPNHCHFICEKCNKSRHIKLSRLDFIKKEIKEDICHFQLDVYGICESCKEKINKREN